MRVPLVVPFLLAWLPAQAPQEFRPSAIFGDHMVLPAAQTVRLHGRGPAGEIVVARPSWGDAREATVRGDTRWQLEIATPARGERGELTLRCGEREVVLRDVLFGDVWLASGQSNMEMPVGPTSGTKGVLDHEREVAAADWPELRVFTTRRRTASVPADDVEGEWVVCTPRTAPQISAVGYYFARQLVRRGHGPIGLVVSSWGGTRAEAWTPREELMPFAEFAAKLRTTGLREAAEAAQRALFFEQIEAATANATTTAARIPERWSRTELDDFDGVVDYERALTLPEAFVGEDLELHLGAIDDMDVVLWNGVAVAGTREMGRYAEPRRYRVPAAAVTSQQVALTIRVIDTGGEGGFAGTADDYVLRVADAPEHALTLAGAWQRRLRAGLDGLPKWPRTGSAQDWPCALWNGMVAPLLPFPFAGVVWYQGESNRTAPEQYRALFPALVRGWRRELGRDVPFYFVQIAPYRYGKDADEQTAALRDAQAAALALPGTGMVVTLDCGEADDIHPRDKRTVGERLAALALARHYGVDVPCCGPVATAAVRDGADVRVRFRGDSGELVLQGDGEGFEVAGADGAFRPATARVAGDEVVLSCKGVDEPVTARYAWRQVPAWSLGNRAGFPAAPFRLAIR